MLAYMFGPSFSVDGLMYAGLFLNSDIFVGVPGGPVGKRRPAMCPVVIGLVRASKMCNL